MKTWHVMGGLAAAALLLTSCGDATGSDEYRALETDAATTQHELDESQTSLKDMTAERDRIETQMDNLRDFVARLEDNKGSRDEALQARRTALKQASDDLKQREDALGQREDALGQRELAIETRATEVAAAADALALAEQVDFGPSGTFVVGKDMAVGSYYAHGGPNCVWAFMSGTGPKAEVIEQKRGYDVQYVAMAEGDVFKTNGCGSWVSD